MGWLSVRYGSFGIAVPLVLVWVCSMTAEAIEVQPSRAQIEAALERGRAAAVARIPPDRLYAWFGTPNELEPRGFLMTKVVGLTVMAAHFALRSATPTESEIARILEDQTLLINVVIFGDRPNFAVDSYMVVEQGGHTIKPIKVRFDGQASRTSVWPKAPAYRAKVVASFPYERLDPRAKTKVSVFPAGGGQVSFELDFSQIE
ncbi:MAG: hypothetical protein ACREIH_06040 [Nitrospiraceae bacterium]